MATKSTKKDDKNTVVILNLDRPRKVRFGHKALKTLGALTGKSVDNIIDDKFDLEDLEKVLFCGLLNDAIENGETLKLEDMEDLLDKAESYGDVLECMHKALDKTFMPTEKN
jgi:hypothetical protein